VTKNATTTVIVQRKANILESLNKGSKNVSDEKMRGLLLKQLPPHRTSEDQLRIALSSLKRFNSI
jgi:hypothetical protein